MPYRGAETGEHRTGVVFHCEASAFLLYWPTCGEEASQSIFVYNKEG